MTNLPQDLDAAFAESKKALDFVNRYLRQVLNKMAPLSLSPGHVALLTPKINEVKAAAGRSTGCT